MTRGNCRSRMIWHGFPSPLPPQCHLCQCELALAIAMIERVQVAGLALSNLRKLSLPRHRSAVELHKR